MLICIVLLGLLVIHLLYPNGIGWFQPGGIFGPPAPTPGPGPAPAPASEGDPWLECNEGICGTGAGSGLE